jgi:hypothetical protein
MVVSFFGGCISNWIAVDILSKRTGELCYFPSNSSVLISSAYSDLGLRIYNPFIKHCINILQSIQLLFNVGIIILGNGQGLSQVAKNKVCFSALCIIWTIIGMSVGQIKTLRNYGWLANSAIWLNILTLIFTMVYIKFYIIYTIVAQFGFFAGCCSSQSHQPHSSNRRWFRPTKCDVVHHRSCPYGCIHSNSIHRASGGCYADCLQLRRCHALH